MHNVVLASGTEPPTIASPPQSSTMSTETVATSSVSPVTPLHLVDVSSGVDSTISTKFNSSSGADTSTLGYSNSSSNVVSHIAAPEINSTSSWATVPTSGASWSPTTISSASEDPDRASPSLARTFTITTVATEPCSKCPGGSNAFTTTSLVTEQCDTSSTLAPGSTQTFTTTAMEKEPCSNCPGGTTTFKSISVVSEFYDIPKASARSVSSVYATESTTTRVPDTISQTTKIRTSSITIGSLFVIGMPSEAGPTPVFAANAGNKDWFSQLLSLLPAVFGL